MYKITLYLPEGKQLEAVEASFLRAVHLVESYHSVVTGYTITKVDTEGGGDDGGCKVD